MNKKMKMKIREPTGDINPFVMEISPFGSCSKRGHSLSDGIYLTNREGNEKQY